jgi:hypothetical protein
MNILGARIGDLRRGFQGVFPLEVIEVGQLTDQQEVQAPVLPLKREKFLIDILG